ncbi:MAG: hypothetical protein QOF76_3910 [Solirubrobacteraceae bacterium]|nr:hypothetical protein [Solirubrobacteraceae bacterium]
MEALELIARFGLAAMFVVAGLAKLADRRGSREALVGFGVPERLAAPGAIALPIAELAAAVLLIPSATAVFGGIAALVLLLAFCAGLARSMARGEAPDCHCFGQIHSEPVGWPSLLRNLALAVPAAFVVVDGLDGSSAAPFSWIGDLSGPAIAAVAGGLVGVAILASAASVFTGMLRRHGVLLLRIEALEDALRGHGIPIDAPAPVVPVEGLPVGTEAPAFTLPGVHGETTTLESLLSAQKPAMLVFTDPGCGPCTALLPQVAAWQRELAGDLTIALISRGSIDDNRAKAAEHGASRMFVEEDGEVSTSYDAQMTPSAVVVASDGTIASPRVAGEPAIRALVDSTLATAGRLQVVAAGPGTAPSAPVIGQPAPDVELQDLAGAPVQLSDFRGEDTMLLFWDPACGFCAGALEDLRSFEADAPAHSPRLLVISKGSAETNEAMDLSSTIVLDPSFAAGNAFAAPGTPSAILLDADGNVASEVAVGSDACLDLARRPAPA